MTLSTPEPHPNPAADPRQDPAMRSLYRMSRTAGVGLQDYAAINVLAVIGVLLALASFLVLVFADVTAMFVLPAAAITISAIAFLQIVRSSGTQTGGLLALAGIVIALGLAGTNVFGRMTVASRERNDRAGLTELVKSFEKAVIGGQNNDAYALFDTRFREAVKPETFERVIASRMARTPDAPHVTAIALGDRVQFETDANGNRFATALMKFTIVNPTGQGPATIEGEEPAEFRRVDDGWKFHTITAWFAAAANQGRNEPQAR